jgi:hypothetical protein
MSWGPFLRGFVGTDGVVEPVLGDAEADVDVEVLGSDFMRGWYSGLGGASRSSVSSSIKAEGGESRGEGRRGLTGSPSMLLLLAPSTFTFDGDLDRGSSKVMEDVEASGEGYACSDLRAIVRNLDMVEDDGTSEDNVRARRALVGLGTQARVWF